jgi:acyl dehydratase
MGKRYFEDFRAGDEFDLGERTVSEEEIVAFARQFDPQPFHVDAAAAAASPFGGIIASGWHTGSMFMRLFVDGVLANSSSIGAAGVDELRWKKPVRPGDRLRGKVRVLDTQLSTKGLPRGTIVWDGWFENQHGDVVMTARSIGLLATRPAPKGTSEA